MESDCENEKFIIVKNRPLKKSLSFKAGVITLALVVAVAGVGAIALTSFSGSKSPEGQELHYQLVPDIVDKQRLSHDANYRLIIVKELLDRVPLIDGHNDWSTEIHSHVGTDLSRVNLRSNLIEIWDSKTDIAHLKEGKLGGQFWSIFCDCDSQYKDAVQCGLQQTALTKAIITRYPDVFELVTSSGQIMPIHSRGKIASMLGMEGGHMIGNNLGTLRQLYELGIRYLTLTQNCNTIWADSCCDSGSKTPNNGGLTDWGKILVHEMNRLGMFVDISHVSSKVMSDVLDTTLSPVIFSHSSAYTLCDHPRNVPDHILRRMKHNRGIVMINFSVQFVNCSETASLEQVADHIEYIKSITGIDHVGIGGDYDGMTYDAPVGLENVSKYPYLLSELLKRGWTISDIEKLAGLNLIRVFKEMEQVRNNLVNELPIDTVIDRAIPDETCATSGSTKTTRKTP